MTTQLSMTEVRSDPDGAQQRGSRVEGAYEALKSAIRDNTFAPGYQGSEQEIATQLGMSRTPVHEAIIRLQEEGLVRVLSRRGVVVCAISPEDMREIYDVVAAVEAASAELLAGKSEGERTSVSAELDAVNAEMEAALSADDLVAWAGADERFHLLLVERSGNRRLVRIFLTVMDQSHRARMLTLRLRPRPTASADQHRAVVAAIRDGDVASAGARARGHRVTARDQILPLLEAFGMRHL